MIVSLFSSHCSNCASLSATGVALDGTRARVGECVLDFEPDVYTADSGVAIASPADDYASWTIVRDTEDNRGRATGAGLSGERAVSLTARTETELLLVDLREAPVSAPPTRSN